MRWAAVVIMMKSAEGRKERLSQNINKYVTKDWLLADERRGVSQLEGEWCLVYEEINNPAKKKNFDARKCRNKGLSMAEVRTCQHEKCI